MRKKFVDSLTQDPPALVWALVQQPNVRGTGWKKVEVFPDGAVYELDGSFARYIGEETDMGKRMTLTVFSKEPATLEMVKELKEIFFGEETAFMGFTTSVFDVVIFGDWIR
jgi:hypothetical protein